MFVKLLKRIWNDYSPRYDIVSAKLKAHNQRLYDLGQQSGEECKELLTAIQSFRDEQFAILKEVVGIYEDVVDAVKRAKNGETLHTDTGLPRSIGDPRQRELVQKYFTYLREENEI